MCLLRAECAVRHRVSVAVPRASQAEHCSRKCRLLRREQAARRAGCQSATAANPSTDQVLERRSGRRQRHRSDSEASEASDKRDRSQFRATSDRLAAARGFTAREAGGNATGLGGDNREKFDLSRETRRRSRTAEGGIVMRDMRSNVRAAG